MLKHASPVAKTAFDALQAKQSAATVGYSRMVVQNEDIYSGLLQQATGESKLRRQTPLVNAGYAARVRAISHAIHAFCQYHEHVASDQNPKVQIVFLGCGADVIGLWSQSLLPAGCVRVVELDMPVVCSVKRSVWVRQGLVEPTNGSDSEIPGQLVGTVRYGDSESTELPDHPNYVLCPTDLRERDDLDRVVEKFVDTSVPTLAVSELVLAYLPPDKVDALLGWCASTLCATPGSAMIALEPLGFKETTDTTPVSVLDGYRRDYCESFGNKMERGASATGKNHDDNLGNTEFHPIASSVQDASDRLLQAGFRKCHAVSLGAAVAHSGSSPDKLTIPETFDEHAALALHLKSYTVACGFPKARDDLLPRILCPAHFANIGVAPLFAKKIVYSVVESCDGTEIRELFYNTYAVLFDDYPMVRRMVKGVMDDELATSKDGVLGSAVVDWYMARGGCFFVAVQYTPSTRLREVVGAVGVRRCEGKDKPNTMEVHRLCVHPECRRKGIARNLLNMVEVYARSRGADALLANTLTILQSAMHVYELCGYKSTEDNALGDMLTLRTYIKPLSSDN